MSDIGETRIDGRSREARAARAAQQQDDAPQQAPNDGEDLTYIPSREDPPTCKWKGNEFMANVPLRVTDKGMIESARTNRFFRVGSEGPVAGDNDPPKTASDYRAHVVAWMKEVHRVDDLVTKWAADRDLRQFCQVGRDDIAWLGNLFEPKLRLMRIEEGLSELDVATIWVRHGEIVIPWRS